MVEDPLDTVLRLVVEGRLTAEEAGPILAALDAKPVADRSAPAPEPEPAAAGANGGRSLRIEVRDGGRTVVNLRLPLALGRYALDRVPGLSGDQVERVKAALNSGLTGPVLVVDDESGGVRIAID
ncbi:MAG: hypothetical protein U0838_18130 [Chloroflexota bacterium]